MIGTNPNLTLPAVGETMAENIARMRTCLSTLQDSVTQAATPSALDMNAPLDMQGNSLLDVASVVFSSGNSSGSPGSIFYFDGDWYVVDAVGMIQLTDGGQLNAASVGGIQGDYGGVNPAAVTFVDSSAQYQFTEDTGAYADLVFRDAILQGLAGTITLHVDDALTGDRDINFKSLPASGKSLLVYDAATSTLEDNAVTRATNGVLVTTIDASGNVEAASFSVDADRVIVIPPSAAATTTASNVYSGSGWEVVSVSPICYPLQLPVGAVFKTARVRCSRNAGGTLTLKLVKVASTGGVVDIATNINNVAGPASFMLEVVALTETIIDDGSAYELRVYGDGTAAQFSRNAIVTVTGRV